MALYEVTVRGSYFNQQTINTFGYITLPGIGVTPSALELITEMGFIPTGDPLAFPAGTIAANWAAAITTDFSFLSVEARELYSLTDFYEAAYSPVMTGDIAAGDPNAPFVAFGLYTARVRLDIRRSFKRFAGVSEGSVNSGGVIASAALTLLDALAASMSEELIGTTAAYAPATISRLKVVDPEDDSVSYELYPTEAEQEEHTAFPLVWTPYTTVRSQTSRQYGRGD